MGRGYTLYNIYRGGGLDVSYQWSVISGQLSVFSGQLSVFSLQLSVGSYRRTRRSRNGWHLKKDEKLRKASQARKIINANFANLANYTNCLVLSGRVGRMKLLGKVGKMRAFFV